MTVGDKPLSSFLQTIEIVPATKGSNLILAERGAYFDKSETGKGREESTREQLKAPAKELAR